MKILVVDDEPAIRDVLVALLEDAGYAVISASGGKQGLELALAERPDLVLLDIMLPDMDGREVCRQIRAADGTAETQVILLSAAIRPSLAECDLSGFVAKPFEVDQLLDTVAEILGR